MFKWGAAKGLVAVPIYTSLLTLSGLKKNRTTAPDNPKRQPVQQEHIDLVRDRVPQRARDLIDLQLLCGARPGELCGTLTTGMIDQAGDVWLADFAAHKMSHLETERVLMFGPKAQLILRRYLKSQEPDTAIFAYAVGSYRCAVKRACKAAGIRQWTPHYLRHNFATQIRDQYDIETSQAACGHASPDTTGIYLARLMARSMRAIREVG